MLKIEIEAKSNTKPLNHFWSNCVGAGRANEGLRANWQKHLKMVVEGCGFKYLRFHGLFHDDMFVYSKLNGKDVYNFQYIDELFDHMLEIGIRPFVEFGFCPNDMASGKATQFWWKGNITPPKDYNTWSKLISKVVYHWIDRYGLDEVKMWYFEVWNEPNLSPFWDGTKSEYFILYKTTCETVKGIHSDLRVGGPATSNFVPDERFDFEVEDKSKQKTFKVDDVDSLSWKAVWIEDFLNYCTHEKLPVDFISTHPYPTDFALDEYGETRALSRSVDATKTDLTYLRNLIDNSAYPEAEIHLTEWSSSPSPKDCSHDYLPAAAFVVKTNIESTGLVDSLSYWTFTDVFEERGAGSSIFYGGFGMINFQGIVKPTYHSYRFLNMLGDEELSRGEGYIVTKSSHDNAYQALFYHYPAEYTKSVPMSLFPNRDIAEQTQAIGNDKEIDFIINNLKPGISFIFEIVNDTSGNALSAWKQMGCPEPPNQFQTQELRKIGLYTEKKIFKVNTKGVLNIRIVLKPWSIVLLSELN